jgi:cyclic pyranopterin phosphate synthase
VSAHDPSENGEQGDQPDPREQGVRTPEAHDDARTEGRLTHVRDDGSAHMVDVSAKAVTARVAIASSRLTTTAQVVDQMLDGSLPKGDALAVARVAGIMAAKRTPDLVPLCHPLPLTGVAVDLERAADDPGVIDIRARVKTTGVTGVEMEALTAASVAALTLYDMVKALDREAVIGPTRVEHKAGGASGDWSR